MSAHKMGAEIRRLREVRGISLRELGRRAEVSPSFLSEIEGGRSYPSESVLERFAEALKVSAAGLRSLDTRPCLTKLRKVLESEPAWGQAFEKLAAAAAKKKVSPEELIQWLMSVR